MDTNGHLLVGAFVYNAANPRALGARMPLRRVAVEADVLDAHAVVRVCQVYENVTAKASPFLFFVPHLELAPGPYTPAAHLGDDDNDRMTLRPAEPAPETQLYRNAKAPEEPVAHPPRAYFTEESAEPGARVTLSLTFVAPLEWVGERLWLRLPRAMCNWPTAPPEPKRTFGRRRTVGSSTQPPKCEVTLLITFDMSQAVGSVGLMEPEEADETHVDGRSARLTWSSSRVLLADVWVYCMPSAVFGSKVWHVAAQAESRKDAPEHDVSMWLWNFSPINLNLSHVTPEIVFVLDKSQSITDSGGMKGLRTVVTSMLQQIPNGTPFNIVTASNPMSVCFARSEPMSKKMLSKGVKFVSGVKASAKATMVHDAVRNVLLDEDDFPPLPRSPRQVVVVTDGYYPLTVDHSGDDGDGAASPTPLSRDVSLITAERSMRVFACGLGHNAEPVCSAIATAGGGMYTIVTSALSTTQVEMRAREVISRVLAPRPTTVRVDHPTMRYALHDKSQPSSLFEHRLASVAFVAQAGQVCDGEASVFTGETRVVTPLGSEGDHLLVPQKPDVLARIVATLLVEEMDGVSRGRLAREKLATRCALAERFGLEWLRYRSIRTRQGDADREAAAEAARARRQRANEAARAMFSSKAPSSARLPLGGAATLANVKALMAGTDGATAGGDKADSEDGAAASPSSPAAARMAMLSRHKTRTFPGDRKQMQQRWASQKAQLALLNNPSKAAVATMTQSEARAAALDRCQRQMVKAGSLLSLQDVAWARKAVTDVLAKLRVEFWNRDIGVDALHAACDAAVADHFEPGEGTGSDDAPNRSSAGVATEDANELPFYWSCAESQGPRPAMEDQHVVVAHLNELVGGIMSPRTSREEEAKAEEDPGRAFFGVYDGHSGDQAATYARVHLHVNLHDHMQKHGADVAAALRGAFVQTDEDFNAAAAKQEGLIAGTTATVCLISDGTLWLANVGDGTAFVVEEGAAVAQTVDHNPSLEEEATRLKAAGVTVVGNRVEFRLAVSRSIGDRPHKDSVIAEPFVASHKITPKTEFIVMASDGLWDVMKVEEVIRFVKDQPSAEMPQAADRLVQEALDRGTQDNVTVCLIFMKRSHRTV